MSSHLSQDVNCLVKVLVSLSSDSIGNLCNYLLEIEFFLLKMNEKIL